MRTVILIGTMMIAEAINPNVVLSESTTNLYAMVIFGAMIMDVLEFIKKLTK